MKKTILFILFVFLVTTSLLQAQDSRIKAIRLKPIYHFDILQGYDSSRVDIVRITFKNSDEMRIRNLKFRIIIEDLQGTENSKIYDAKHELAIIINPEEVLPIDIPLFNSIAPPDGQSSFENLITWRWEVKVISINKR